ncbi:MAG: BglG family transcription antiterminator [Coprobacillaceae bacterium]
MVNQLSLRQLKLLSYLQQQKKYISGAQLSKQFNVSSKTIRNDIHSIILNTSSNKLEIEALPSKGFLLHIYDENYLEQLQYHPSVSIPTTPIERSYYIIKQLLLTDHYIRIDELSEILFIDRTSISRSLKHVRECLTNYSLTLVNRPNYGLKIEGEEFYLRLCMAEYMYHKQSPTTPIDPAFANAIYVCLKDAGISIPDGALSHLLIHIVIMIQRIQENHPIVFTSSLQKPEPCYEYLISKDLSSIIKEHYHTLLSDDELAYLSIHLLGKRTNSISAIESCINNSLIPSLATQIEEVFDQINYLFGISFHDDYYLKKALGIHFNQMYTRLEHTTFLRNSVLQDIKTQYPLAYAISMEAWNPIIKHHSLIKVDHEIAFISVHFQYALERKQRNKKKKSILLINDNRASTTELLSFTLLKRFDSLIEINKTINPKELDTISLDPYDIILTTTPIQKKVIIPIFSISAIITNQQLDALEEKINNQLPILLSNYLKLDYIQLQIEVDNQTQCLEYIYKQITNKEKVVVSKKAFLSLEKLAANELHYGIAISKIFTSSNKTKIYCFTLKKPIIWNETMVRIIFVMVLKKNDNEHILSSYQLLSQFIKNDKQIDTLLKATTIKELQVLDI